jgi:peptidoglycan/LPS O-acetylase OafA/YrhL
VAQFVQKNTAANTFSGNFWIYFFPAVFTLLIISSGFYLLIEKPCMERDWHIKLLNKMSFVKSKKIKA